MDPVSLLGFLGKKIGSVAASSCPTLTPFFPDTQIHHYLWSAIKGGIHDLAAPMFWQALFVLCGTILVGYGTYSVITHANEIYQIMMFYKQILASPEMVFLLNTKYEFLNAFNRVAAELIAKKTFGLLYADACQIIVKFCLYNNDYKFHEIIMDISNSNML